MRFVDCPFGPGGILKYRTCKTIMAVSVLGTLGMAQPITKTGAARLHALHRPLQRNWGQFPINPIASNSSGTIQNPLPPSKAPTASRSPPASRRSCGPRNKSGTLNPGLAYIQHFTFDERGRMWAVEPRSYPNTIRAASGTITDNKFQGGQDRILILEDTDGDKVMDKIKVFKNGLNLPQGIEVVKGGVVVAMTPYLVFFPNNDDVAGTPRDPLQRHGLRHGNLDTHGGISSLMYGLDNWIYGHTGFNRLQRRTSAASTAARASSWRFRHIALGHGETKFEVWTTGPANAWGIGQMEDGQIFQSGATGTAHINHSIRKGVTAIDIRSGTGANLFYPITGDR